MRASSPAPIAAVSAREPTLASTFCRPRSSSLAAWALQSAIEWRDLAGRFPLDVHDRISGRAGVAVSMRKGLRVTMRERALEFRRLRAEGL